MGLEATTSSSHFFCPLFANHTATPYQAELYQRIVVDIRVSVSCFSFVGSLFVIGLIWLFKKYKFFVQRLILYLSISAFLSSTAYIMGRVDYDPSSHALMKFCEFQGFWLLLTDWMVVLSIFCVTFNLLWSVFTEKRHEKIEIFYVAFTFLAPIPISCIPFIHNSFGPSGAWCWIQSIRDNCTPDRFAKYLQFGVWYVPQYIIIFSLFVMYIVIIVKLKTKVKSWQGTYDPNVERKKALLNGEIKPLVWYPTVYFVVCIFPLINRIYFSATDQPQLVLYVLHVLSAPLQGALTALVYALDRDTLKRLNWHNIKASFQYRNTDAVVREYPVGPESDSESRPFINDTKYNSIDESSNSSYHTKLA